MHPLKKKLLLAGLACVAISSLIATGIWRVDLPTDDTTVSASITQAQIDAALKVFSDKQGVDAFVIKQFAPNAFEVGIEPVEHSPGEPITYVLRYVRNEWQNYPVYPYIGAEEDDLSIN